MSISTHNLNEIISKYTLMESSHCWNCGGAGTNGFYDTVWKLSHYILTGTGGDLLPSIVLL